MAVSACGHRHGGLLWSPLWGHETLYWVREQHADTATEALGGAPYGARNVTLGGGTTCGHRQ
eukprot:6911129-Pyramimonas_sp.AAC.1